jgi:succinylarginine dihydrolase
MIEINFDGLIGPSHNYAGLSLGNVASARNAGGRSRPRAAALQGVAKMRTAMALGLTQGLLVPLARPDVVALRALGFAGGDAAICAQAHAADPALFAQMLSASAMWTANAATVSPGPDTDDGRCHLTVANLSTMPHRSIEHRATEAQLRLAFGGDAFVVHPAVPGIFGDEGAANHMRIAASHGAPGTEVFVYGEAGSTEAGSRFPARQNLRASQAVARFNRLDPARTLFVQQSPEAIAAGAFHNDVVAVANGHVLFTHALAFADPPGFYAALKKQQPRCEIIEVPADVVSLEDAITSYLFNSQLLTLPDGSMALILPMEAQENPRVNAYLQALITGNGPIRRTEFVAVRESMRNGGGPACLRLRVVVQSPEQIDPRFLMSPAKADRLEALITRYWPESIAPEDLGAPELWQTCWRARAALLAELEMTELA